MQNKVDLSIVIVNYNTKKLTAECVESIISHTKRLNYEIIIIDNFTTDESVNFLSKEFPDIRIIANKQNLGYAKANNQGIKEAKGRAILLLNSDTKITKSDVLEKSVELLRKKDILTINIQAMDGHNQQAAGFGPNLLNLFFWAFFLDDLPILRNLVKPYQISSLKYFDTNHDVDWVIGAFFLAKREVFEKTGYLDERIFMYGEEMEFCRRARKNGYNVGYFCQPSIIHYGMGSAESSDSAIIGEYQALKYFFQKHEPQWKNYILSAIIKASIVLRIIIFNLIRRKKAKIYAKAFYKV